jgi:hypothetical protein
MSFVDQVHVIQTILNIPCCPVVPLLLLHFEHEII